MTDFDEILHTDASPPSGPQNDKISQFKQSKMAVAAILKIRKIANISAMERPIVTKFGTVMRLGPPATVSQ